MKKQISGTIVTFTFDGLDSVMFDATKVSAPNRAYAEMHGWQARIGDNAAIARKDKNGNVVTVTEAMRREAVLELVNHYQSDSTDWTVRGGTRAAPQNPTILAIAAKLGLTYEQAEAEVQKRMLAELSE